MREGELVVWHVLGGEGALPAEGDQVEGQLDWERRHALMRTHTALHVLSAVIWRDQTSASSWFSQTEYRSSAQGSASFE